MDFLKLGPYKQFLSHFRFLLTLRSEQGKYHSLILFRLADCGALETHLEALNVEDKHDNVLVDHKYKQLYVMESACPHLGADLSHADIEECEDSVVAVCPWHRYDFDLRTGKSDSGLKACTYSVEVRNEGKDGKDNVWIQTPNGGTSWRCVELRPVSEAFADPPPPVAPAPLLTARIEESVVPENPPTTLMQWGVLILNTSNPTLKVERTRHAVHMFRTGQLTSIGHRSSKAPSPPDEPPREAVSLDNRNLKGRRNLAAMLHSLANVEQWAIDLAWDIMVRFGPQHHDLPPAFFSDFTKMALDESKHFSLLCSRLSATSPGTPYGSMPVHAALWESATQTQTLRSRLAIVHMVHEARGLDVNPRTIERFKGSGDKASVAALEIIHADEVTHVTAGHRWFSWVCEKEGIEPVEAFRDEVKRGWRGELQGPFNEEDRERAGMTRDYYVDLKGEMGWEEREMNERDKVAEEKGAAAAKVQIEIGPQ